jgi:hypothetical protein
LVIEVVPGPNSLRSDQAILLRMHALLPCIECHDDHLFVPRALFLIERRKISESVFVQGSQVEFPELLGERVVESRHLGVTILPIEPGPLPPGSSC